MHVARGGDWVVIVGFLLAVAVLYGSAAFLLIRRFVCVPQRAPRLGGIGYLVLFTASAGLLLLAYGLFIEPYQLEVIHVRIPISGLKTPVKIVQFSDLHCDTTVRLEHSLPEVIARQSPDLIVFTGDAINSRDAFSIFKECMHKVMPIAPTFAVKGDWDFAFDPLDVLKASGVNVLNNRSEVVMVRGNKLCIAGADSGASCRSVLDRAPKGMPTIFLYHNPDGDIILERRTGSVNLYCCGHTHGGQVSVPGYGALITQSVQGKQYESGLKRLGNTWIYTNRGIGMEGHFPRIRLGAKPELTVFELTPSIVEKALP